LDARRLTGCLHYPNIGILSHQRRLSIGRLMNQLPKALGTEWLEVYGGIDEARGAELLRRFFTERR
jgi:hypothetical protein